MYRRIAIALLSVAAGNQLLSYAFGVRYYVDSPAAGLDWGVRFVITLLYPK